MEQAWLEPLMRCAEGLYVLDEQTHRMVWANEYVSARFGGDCVGKPCWQALFGRESACPFCPPLEVGDEVYAWDYFDSHSKHWMKVKHLLFRHEGTLYRAGNINIIDDVMGLNYETVQEISMLQTVLNKNKGAFVKLEKEAIYDSLTGLYNRNCFHMDLQEVYTGVPGLGVLYCDLNNLKEANDRYRHETGDALLRRLAQVLLQVARHRKNAKCYRIGGDEFVLICAGCTEADFAGLLPLFNQYMKAYNQNEPHPCSVAVGHAFSADACDPEALVGLADSEMYREKRRMKGLDTP